MTPDFDKCRPTRRRRRALATLAAALMAVGVLATGALAQGAGAVDPAQQTACKRLLTPGVAPIDSAQVARLQSGLRAALAIEGDETLQDGLMGPRTRKELTRLCEWVPFQAGTDPVAETLALANTYADLSLQDDSWPAVRRDTGFLADLIVEAEAGPARRVLALAATPEMAAAVTRRWTPAERAACGTYSGLESLSEADAKAVRAGLSALAGADPALGLAVPSTEGDLAGLAAGLTAVCEVYPVLGGPSDVVAAVADIGRLDAARPGTVADLLGSGFASWLVEDTSNRLLRLMGNVPTVVPLVASYAASEGQARPTDTDIVALPRPRSCVVRQEVRLPRFFAFPESDLDRLIARDAVGAALAGLDGQVFADVDALALATLEALGPGISGCAADLVRQRIERPGAPARIHTVDADAVARLALNPEFMTDAPVLAGFVGTPSDTEQALLDGIEAAMTAAVRARLTAEVEDIAEQVAGTAEESLYTFDVQVEGVEEGDPFEVVPPLVVTENTIAVLRETVTDEAYLRAIETADLAPAAMPEVLQADILRLLRGDLNKRIETQIDFNMDQARNALGAQFALTGELADEIAGLPELAPVGADLPDRLAPLVGVRYPSERLMVSALKSLEPEPSPAEKAVVVDVARRVVANPSQPREVQRFAGDCGCVAPRARENAVVYGFHPFWAAPPVSQDGDSAGADEGSDAEAAGAGDTPELPTADVDFELFEHVAFFGLEVDETGRILYERRWRDQSDQTVARRFINAAHQHRAKADLAIRLRGWEDWGEEELTTAIDGLAGLMEPLAPLEGLNLRERFESLPTYFDSLHPDGLTLHLEDYTGVPNGSPGVGNIVSLVSALAPILRSRNQQIHLSVDVPLVTGPGVTEPLFADLSRLLAPARGAPLVKYVLVFLERPTTDAKKVLRSRVERAFSGAQRADVLRSIIPVMPSGGHDLVHASSDDPLDPTPFSQLYDDLAYFKNNFAGVGFFTTSGLQKSLDSPVSEMVGEFYDEFPLPDIFKSYETEITAYCNFACPNRIYYQLSSLILFGAAVGLTLLSFFNGPVNTVAFKFWVVPLAFGGVLAGLLTLTVCDVRARAAPYLLVILVAAIVVWLLFSVLGRGAEGRKP